MDDFMKRATLSTFQDLDGSPRYVEGLLTSNEQARKTRFS